MKKISLKISSIFGLFCFLSTNPSAQAMQPGSADSQESPKFLRQTRSGVQLKRKEEDASQIIASQGTDRKTIEQLADLYRLTHSERFGDAKTAAERPKDYLKAARVMRRKAKEAFGEAYDEARLEENYEKLKKQQKTAVPLPLTKTKACRRRVADSVNALERVREPLSQDIRGNASQAGISPKRLKEEAKKRPSLTDLVKEEPTQSPHGSQTSGSTTQSMGSQDTWVLPTDDLSS